MTKRIACMTAATLALALGLAGPVAAQDKSAPEKVAPSDKPGPKSGTRGIIWQENTEI